jgi:agmatinase
MRGSLYGPEDAAMPQELGFEVVECDELVTLSPEAYAERVRRRVGDEPLFLSFDIDVLDRRTPPERARPRSVA